METASLPATGQGAVKDRSVSLAARIEFAVGLSVQRRNPGHEWRTSGPFTLVPSPRRPETCDLRRLGLSSPGHNLLKSTDGGHNWSEVVVPSLPPAVPVISITFSDATHGTFTSPSDTWTTVDGGTTWVKTP